MTVATDEPIPSTTLTFQERLRIMQQSKRFVCVGLDSKLSRLPQHLVDELGPYGAQLEFNKQIVDKTCDFAGAYKPNLAFYTGAEGKEVLRQTIAYIRLKAPNALVIIDAKQGDIDSTNDGYIEDDFGYYGVDAVTVHNYMGMEAMKPYLDQADQGVIVLCRTSNKGAGELQDVPCSPLRYLLNGKLYSTIKELMREEGLEEAPRDNLMEQVEMPFYLFVAHRVVQSWNYNGNCLMVVGATSPEELAMVRAVAGLMAILLPGIGAQGGPLESTLDAGQNADGEGMVINNSRSIIFAFEKDESRDNTEFAESAREVGLVMHHAILDHLGLAV